MCPSQKVDAIDLVLLRPSAILAPSSMFDPENSENDFFVKLGFNFDPKNLVKGKVLISEPFLPDPNFSRSVVLLTEYTPEEGAFGFILNKPTDLDMQEIIDKFPTPGFPFHYGGPVNPETLFFLHTAGKRIAESKEVYEDLFWSGDYEEVISMITLGQLSPTDVKFFGGYSGWGTGQLERELSERSWIISSLTTADVMHTDAHSMWKKTLKTLGPKFSIMAEFPENPGLN